MFHLCSYFATGFYHYASQVHHSDNCVLLHENVFRVLQKEGLRSANSVLLGEDSLWFCQNDAQFSE